MLKEDTSKQLENILHSKKLEEFFKRVITQWQLILGGTTPGKPTQRSWCVYGHTYIYTVYSIVIGIQCTVMYMHMYMYKYAYSSDAALCTSTCIKCTCTCTCTMYMWYSWAAITSTLNTGGCYYS